MVETNAKPKNCSNLRQMGAIQYSFHIAVLLRSSLAKKITASQQVAKRRSGGQRMAAEKLACAGRAAKAARIADRLLSEESQ
jgi:hypothetical protein